MTSATEHEESFRHDVGSFLAALAATVFLSELKQHEGVSLCAPLLFVTPWHRGQATSAPLIIHCFNVPIQSFVSSVCLCDTACTRDNIDENEQKIKNISL